MQIANNKTSKKRLASIFSAIFLLAILSGSIGYTIAQSGGWTPPNISLDDFPSTASYVIKADTRTNPTTCYAVASNGSICWSSTNAGTVFYQCENALPSIGGSIEFGVGTFTSTYDGSTTLWNWLNPCFTITKPTIVSGQGQATIIKLANNVLSGTGNGYPLFVIASSGSGSIITNLEIDGNKANQLPISSSERWGTCNILLENADNVLVTGISTHDSVSGNYYVEGLSENCTFSESYTYNAGKAGVTDADTRAGINLDGARDIKLSGLTEWGSGIGLAVVNASNTMVERCTFYSNRYFGSSFALSYNCSLSDITFTGNARSDLINLSGGKIITKNIISNNNLCPIVDDYPAAIYMTGIGNKIDATINSPVANGFIGSGLNNSVLNIVTLNTGRSGIDLTNSWKNSGVIVVDTTIAAYGAIFEANSSLNSFQLNIFNAKSNGLNVYNSFGNSFTGSVSGTQGTAREIAMAGNSFHNNIAVTCTKINSIYGGQDTDTADYNIWRCTFINYTVSTAFASHSNSTFCVIL